MFAFFKFVKFLITVIQTKTKKQVVERNVNSKQVTGLATAMAYRHIW